MPREILAKLTELSADLVEPALDVITDNQIVKDIPVLGSAVKIAGLSKTISDRIFLVKIRRFLDALEPSLSPKIQHFAEEISSGDQDASRVAETLLLAIEASDDLAKAPIIAAVFQSFLQGNISKSEFRRMVAAVNAAIVDDLLKVADIGENPSGSAEDYSDLLEALRHTGLTDTALNIVTHGTIDLGEAITPLGKAFAHAVSNGYQTTKKAQEPVSN